MNAMERNFKGDLQELLVQNHKMLPIYEEQEIAQNGQQRFPTFQYTVSLGGFQRTGRGNNKKNAQQRAAELMLTDIKSNLIELNSIPNANDYKVKEGINYIGKLQELLAKEKKVDPEYEFQECKQNVDPFHCTVHVGAFQKTGLGSSKIEAKQKAAEEMLRDISSNIIDLNEIANKPLKKEEAKAKQMTSPSDLLSKSGDQEKILYLPEHDELPTDWPDPSKHDPFRIKVIEIPETEDGKQMKNLFEGAASGKYRIYPMLNSRRGIALIINNMNFQQARNANVNLKDRKGSEYDQMALDMLFEQLGFKRVVRKDYTLQEMLDEVCEQVSVAGSTNQDCFVFVVLSHGERGHVFGVDGKKVHLDKFEEAVDSPLLIDKPKLLFIQACQGDRGDTGIRHDGGKEISSQMPEVQNLHQREESDGASSKWVPSRADIFIATATVPNYFSWRNENWGTWFIQAVAFVFSKFAYKYDLNNLMLMVNDLVKKAKTDNYRQISTFSCSHTRSLFFFPGLTYSPPS